ncbi:N-acetylmuramoyl-L-alanine amidase [Jatrophihabitans telluris]|uniref:N-acetylmuramoyl-L-alanine amidase n=1 Tax=Jatrophihabitans telluris TaxID=2038343 RepID=A0ABY4QYZ3_9ACTN|nr:N-acetylmuramoyl-L-alanine amidase [Jatrophihabitans telluris]UQX88543.1 N-acetylmuramoyl-L-alanine amidase [Jatrophihabitans telluris]
MQIYRLGDRNNAVSDARRILAMVGLLDNTDPGVEDLFDPATETAVRALQQRRGLTIDGVIGPETLRALQGARWRLGDRTLGHNATTSLFGDDVIELQRQLLEIGFNAGRLDGNFGPTTADALRSFQRDMGLLADGVCGPQTLRALKQLDARRVRGGAPQMLRDLIAVADAGPNLLGKRIVIDPGHGGDDSGVSQDGVNEANVVFDLATRLEGRLTALGVTTWLTRGRNIGPDDESRAQFANAQGADLVLSLHVDASPSPHANGVATYYYGAGEVSSSIGERFADLVQREVVARTGMVDGRTHPKSWTLLLHTAMPTIRLELGYISSPVDRPRLIDPAFRDRVAEGLLAAIQRLYLPRDLDPPTGVLRLPAFAS